MPTTTLHLPAGEVLTVTAGAAVSGTILRRPASAGAANTYSSETIAASQQIVKGPYGVPTFWTLDSTGGDFTTAVAASESYLTAEGVGSVPASAAIRVTESGDGAVHKTVITLTALSVTMTDATTAGSHGTQKVYDFPAGAIQILGASYDLTTLAGSGGIADAAALIGALGTAAISTDNATLTSTEADLIASTVGTLTAGAGTLKKHGSLVATAFDGTSTAKDAILNIAVPDADSSANDTVTVSGTITIVWANLGDY